MAETNRKERLGNGEEEGGTFGNGVISLTASPHSCLTRRCEGAPCLPFPTTDAAVFAANRRDIRREISAGGVESTRLLHRFPQIC